MTSRAQRTFTSLCAPPSMHLRGVAVCWRAEIPHLSSSSIRAIDSYNNAKDVKDNWCSDTGLLRR